ncbi:alpha/beta hydrolase [Promicromonospora sp. NPDC023987]|uniref:alpha/beta fold hydrolase n=1 Tax=Promicromonospora sp. NPDC023987 TaxID=3155360 RepID=UPI0033CC92C6
MPTLPRAISRRLPRRRTAALTTALALLVTGLAACAPQESGGRPADAPPAATQDTATRSTAAHAAATRDDPEFEETFRHEFASVDGVRMHYVTGGSGTPVVLLHGWPQTWFGWWSIMPELAERHTVYAVDLPGLGDSTGTPTGYDKATLARYVHALVADQLGVRDAHVVGHDLGAAVAYQYAAQFPADTASLGYLDLPLPGPALDAPTYRTMSWHIAFHSQPEVPEALVDDDVREYLAMFYPQVAFEGAAFGGTSVRSPFTEAEIDEYARTYSRPDALTGGFELYRSLDQDVRDTTAADPVDTPTLLLTAQGQLDPVRATTAGRLTNVVRAADVPGAGHWLVEENPEFVTAELLRFLEE